MKRSWSASYAGGRVRSNRKQARLCKCQLRRICASLVATVRFNIAWAIYSIIGFIAGQLTLRIQIRVPLMGVDWNIHRREAAATTLIRLIPTNLRCVSGEQTTHRGSIICTFKLTERLGCCLDGARHASLSRCKTGCASVCEVRTPTDL